MVLLFIILIFLYFVVFRLLSDMKVTSFFGGDEWEYQSMAVNFAKGHGIQKFGCMEPFETYKFEKQDKLPEYYSYFVSAAGQDRFYRTPMYPLFLGIVYKIFGIHPVIAKSIQLLMLVIIAASLPFIGLHYFGKIGFVAGMPSGVLYLATNYLQCDGLLTEPLISMALFLIILALMAYERRPNIVTSVILGVSMGMSLLTKGSLVFIPILLCAVFLVRIILKKDFKRLKLLVIIAGSVIFTVLPWSLYASIRSNKIIILSTQGSAVLLEMNNEFCVDGAWHPEYSNLKDSFYNNDGIDKSHTALKVANFYWKNPRLFLKIMSKKLINGFSPFIYFWLYIAFVLLNEICRIFQKMVRGGPVQVIFFSTILAIGFLICYYCPEIILSIVKIRVSMLMFLLIGIFAWLTYLYFSGKMSIPIPTSFLVIWSNFLLMTLVSGAISRYIVPMNFIFIFLCCLSALHLFFEIFDKLALQAKNIKMDIPNVPAL